MAFDTLELKASTHAVLRWKERSGVIFNSSEEAELDLINKVNESTIVIENEYYRYYKYDNFLIPAAFKEESNRRYLRVVTVLESSMIEDRFDDVLVKYIEGAAL